LLAEISAKLDKVVGFLAIEGRDQSGQIRILRGLGFEWNEIGMMVGLSADAARMRFNTLKTVKDNHKSQSKRSTKGAD
jgi:hypothetical protein